MLKKTSLRVFVLALALIGVSLLGACATQPTPTVVPTAVPTQPPPQPTATSLPTETPLPTATAPPEPTPLPTETPTAQPTEESIRLTDGFGKVITLPAPAQRVISLAPSNTEILFAIGAGAQVVGRDTFSDYPTEALEVTDIGGGWGELDTETILSLQPDLVLAADIIAPEQIQTLEDLGLTVFVLSNANDFEQLYENLEIVARLTGHEQQAAALVEELKARVSAVEEKVARVEVPKLVFYQLDSTDPNAPWTTGPDTFIDNLITMAGGVNVGHVLDGPWAQISLEELIVQDPDVILVGDYTWGGVTPEDVIARPGWEALTAVQTGQVFVFDDNLVSRPGPRLVEGLETMAQLLHPELFEK